MALLFVDKTDRIFLAALKPVLWRTSSLCGHVGVSPHSECLSMDVLSLGFLHSLIVLRIAATECTIEWPNQCAIQLLYYDSLGL